MKNKVKTITISLLILLLIIFAISLMVGSYPLEISDLISIISLKETGIKSHVFYSLRLPRAMMGLLAGLCLGMAGAAYQVVFSNPLASPDLTGVASGASLGAAVAIVFHVSMPFEITVFAFVSGMLSLLLVIILVKLTGQMHISSYILSGIIISSLAEALIMVFKYMADPLGELASIEFWTMGSLASITADKMTVCLLMTIIPFVVLCLLQRQIIILSLGDEQSQYLGLNAKKWRIVILMLTTWLVASVVSLTGVISFVGLIAPHIVYLMIRKRTGVFLVLSGIVGAILILVGDMLSRSVVPNAEIPLSIFTIMIAIPVLIYWLYRQRGHIV